MITKPQAWGEQDPERESLSARVRAGGASAEDRRDFARRHIARAQRVLAAPIDDLYEVVDVSMTTPRPARIHTSITCADCGESTMETRIRWFNANPLCPPCFEAEMSGRLAIAPPRRIPAEA